MLFSVFAASMFSAASSLDRYNHNEAFTVPVGRGVGQRSVWCDRLQALCALAPIRQDVVRIRVERIRLLDLVHWRVYARKHNRGCVPAVLFPKVNDTNIQDRVKAPQGCDRWLCIRLSFF